MRFIGRTVGIASLFFGVGVLLCVILPFTMLVVLQAVLIITAGFFLYLSR